MDDIQLKAIIEGCKRGDRDDFSRLVDIFSGPCYGYFVRLSGDRTLSEDLLSELFLKLIDRINSYNGGSFKSWLFTIATNLWRDHLRSEYRRRKLADDVSHETTDHIDSDTVRLEISDELQAGLSQLDPDTAELIMLRFFSELSFKELSKVRSEPIGTTLAKTHRGLKKLREIMGSRYGNEQGKSEGFA